MKKKARRQRREEWEYFDDCAICQAMKQAAAAWKELSLTALRAAFGEQKKRQAEGRCGVGE